jgi:hypothetical protein
MKFKGSISKIHVPWKSNGNVSLDWFQILHGQIYTHMIGWGTNQFFSLGKLLVMANGVYFVIKSKDKNVTFSGGGSTKKSFGFEDIFEMLPIPKNGGISTSNYALE